jgi:transcriptional regulator with XRE-family HTH domain
MQAIRQSEMRVGSAPAGFPVLSQVVRELRRRNGWTLKQLSERSGIPVSTLAKVETGRLTLSYERLVQLAERTRLSPQQFLGMGTPTAVFRGARRSTQRWEEAVRSVTDSKSAYPMCAELLGKRMDLTLLQLSARGRTQLEGKSGDGEAYYFVVAGSVQIATEFYRAETLSRGDSIYLDMLMHHSLSLSPSCEEASIVRICCDPCDLQERA